MTAPARPEGLCPNCVAAWRARRPRPAAMHCWHAGLVAWPIPGGWHVERAFKSTLERLRAEERL